MTTERGAAPRGGRRLERCAAVFLALAWAGVARAQTVEPATIVFDGSLGPAGDAPFKVKKDARNQEVRKYRIPDSFGRFDDGFQTLFHSFERFGIEGGDSATFTFTSLHTPERVVARVTGGERSEIGGWLGVRNAAGQGVDLFLLNPSGIDLGDDAHLDLPGSLYLATADALRFEGFDFSTGRAEPLPPSLLVSAPSAFGFTDADFASITLNRSRGLAVPPGETLSLIGGDPDGPGPDSGVGMISREGMGANVVAPGASVEIASAAGSVEIPVDLARLDPAALAPGALGDVVIEAATSLDVSTPPAGGVPSGSVVIRGGRFVLNRATVQARNQVAEAAPGPAADVAVTGEARIEAGSQITTWTAGEGRGGDVSIRGRSVVVSGPGTRINTFATGAAEGPSIELRGDEVAVSEKAQVLSLTLGPGPGGRIAISGTLSVSDGGSAQSVAQAAGPGGNIEIHAARVEVSNATDAANGTFISTDTLSTAPGAGDGGSLMIYAESVDLEQGGQLIAFTEGAGDAGSLSLYDAHAVRLHGRDAENRPAAILSRALEPATGNAGKISIDTRILEVADGATISSSTLGRGNAGAPALVGGIEVFEGIDIHASERVTVEGGTSGASLVSSASSGLGRGGTLAIETDVLELHRGGQVTVSASGAGDAGSIRVDARRVEISGVDPGTNQSGIFAQALFPGPDAGDGGDVTVLAAERLDIADRGRISVSTTGSGDAGTIELRVGQDLGVAGGGSIAALSTATGAGGEIRITTSGSMRMSGGAEVTARSVGKAPAGDVTIDAGERFEAERSAVTTESERSSGGKITIRAGELFYVLEGEVSTSVQDGTGGGGDLTIDPEFVVLNDGRIIARAFEGPGGNISIRSGTFFASTQSVVDASSKLGISGTVNVAAPENELVNELAPLPVAYLDPSASLGTPCEARISRAGSLQVQRRAPPPALPDAPLGLPDPGQLGSVASGPAACAPQGVTP